VPEMETGASDCVYTMHAGIPSYGISGEGIDEDDIRAHCKDERLRVSSLDEGLQFFYLFLREIAPRDENLTGASIICSDAILSAKSAN
jgi:acetylornithine deacetylase/succinyl-diaminopimelate desuccinylase-like protein